LKEKPAIAIVELSFKPKGKYSQKYLKNAMKVYNPCQRIFEEYSKVIRRLINLYTILIEKTYNNVRIYFEYFLNNYKLSSSTLDEGFIIKFSGFG
jgi:hypothetical protein